MSVLHNGVEIFNREVYPNALSDFYRNEFRFEFTATEPSTVRILVRKAQWSEFQVRKS